MRQSPTTPHLDFCVDESRRGILSSVLLLTAGIWLSAIVFFLTRAEDTSRFVALFGALALATLLIAYATWSTNETWDDWGRIGIWFVFGLSLSLWMIGIFSIGWFLFPSLFMTAIALIMWPIKFDKPIAAREGILAEIAGFLSGPILVVLTLSIFGFQ